MRTTFITKLLIALLLVFPSAEGFAAGTKTQLRVAYSSISGSAVIPWIAVDKGIFAKYDLDVELIYVAGSPAMQSLLGGTTQVSIQGIEPVMRVNAQGGDTVMIVGLVTKPPFSIIVRPEIREPKDLKGRAMGVTRFGSVTDALLRLALDKWGLRPESDVPIIQMGGVPPILSGMQSKKIFGGPISLPTLAVAKQEGFRELFSFFTDKEYADIPVATFTRDDMLQTNAALVERFVRAQVKGLLYMRANRDGAAGALARALKSKESETGPAFDEIRPTMTEDGTITLDEQRKALEYLLSPPQQKEPPRLERMYDFTLARKAYQELQARGWKPE